MQHAIDASAAGVSGSAPKLTNRRSTLSRLRALLAKTVRVKATQRTHAADGQAGTRPVLPPEFIDELTGRS